MVFISSNLLSIPCIISKLKSLQLPLHEAFEILNDAKRIFEAITDTIFYMILFNFIFSNNCIYIKGLKLPLFAKKFLQLIAKTINFTLLSLYFRECVVRLYWRSNIQLSKITLKMNSQHFVLLKLILLRSNRLFTYTKIYFVMSDARFN